MRVPAWLTWLATFPCTSKMLIAICFHFQVGDFVHSFPIGIQTTTAYRRPVVRRCWVLGFPFGCGCDSKTFGRVLESRYWRLRTWRFQRGLRFSFLAIEKPIQTRCRTSRCLKGAGSTQRLPRPIPARRASESATDFIQREGPSPNAMTHSLARRACIQKPCGFLC